MGNLGSRATRTANSHCGGDGGDFGIYGRCHGVETRRSNVGRFARLHWVSHRIIVDGSALRIPIGTHSPDVIGKQRLTRKDWDMTSEYDCSQGMPSDESRIAPFSSSNASLGDLIWCPRA